MRIRTRQGALAAMVMLACVGIMFGLALGGIARMEHVQLWSAACVVGLLVFFCLIRSGYSLRWKDPSMAMAQMLYAITGDALAYVITGHARGVCLPLLAVILMFGVFGMSTRQMLVVALYAFGLFVAATGYIVAHPSDDDPVGVLYAYLCMVLLVLSSITLLTWRLVHIRENMRRQRSQLTHALEKIQKIATRDELTGTANRRFMQDQLRQAIQRFYRTSAPLMVAMLDIDYFKRVNDTYGHQAGDRCLQVFAQEVQACIRANDTLARWGGEEFLILLNDAEFSFGLACLERVRARVAAMVVVFAGAEIRFTVSIGVTQYQMDDSIEKTVDRADLALYAAKAQGRDRVVSA